MRRLTAVGLVWLGSIVLFGCDRSHLPTHPSPLTPAAAMASAGQQSVADLSVTWSCFESSAACPPRAGQLERQAVAGDAPGTPLNLTFAVNGTTVTITWTAPAAGDAPTSYVIDAGIITFDTGSTATSLTVTGVPSGSYTVRVRARNTQGISGPSNDVLIVVGAPPGGNVTGRWLGLAPDGFLIDDPTSCDSELDVLMDLAHSGNVVAGSFTSRTRRTTCGQVGFIATAGVNGTESGGVITLRVPQDRGRTAEFQCTVAGTRMTCHAVGYAARLLVTRQ